MGDYRRFLRFGVVGFSGIVVNFGFYVILHDWAGIYDLLSLALAIELSILNNFIWNELWTFRDRRRGGISIYLARMAGFHISSGLVAMSVQLLNQYIETRLFAVWDKLALLIGIGLGAVANYFICNRWIFRAGTERTSPPV